MTLRSVPYSIDFLGNSPEFKIRTNDFLVKGRKYKCAFIIDSLPVGTLIIKTPYFLKSWTITAEGGQNSDILKSETAPVKILEQLSEKVAYNFSIFDRYNVSLSAESNGCVLTLEDKTEVDYNGQNILVYVEVDGVRRNYQRGERVSGITPVKKNDFNAYALFEVKTQRGSEFTQPMVFSPNNSEVTINTNPLKPFFKAYDVPQINEPFAGYACNECVKEARLLYASMENGNVELIKKSPYFFVINGELQKYNAQNNTPDWETMRDTKFYRAEYVDIFSQDNNAKVISNVEAEQYLYLFNPSRTDVNMQASINVAYRNRNPQTINRNLCTGESLIVRVPVGLSSLGVQQDSDIVFYTVTINTGENNAAPITRTFLMEQKPQYGAQMLLLNKMNLYESFTFESFKKECTTEGDKVTDVNGNRHEITDAHVLYTAKTGWKTAKEIAALEHAMKSDGNLLLLGSRAFFVSMVPNTYTIVNEDENLLEVEVQFVLTKQINRASLFFPTEINNIYETNTRIK